ncbi:hypothetical protein [Trichococcus paludicola]|uniref:hypothetical protein n=1 Tax=Trichococcus paludicola TaxID=2052942 RepID=UPI00131DE4B4|nr:hypothetical protein [Trichococcus paludicola]
MDNKDRVGQSYFNIKIVFFLKVDRQNFILTWEQMDKQAIYIAAGTPNQTETQTKE